MDLGFLTLYLRNGIQDLHEIMYKTECTFLEYGTYFIIGI
jgi:hypothetical protein